MPVYQLTDQVVFPPADHARSDGLLAVGGDLSIERLLLAYASGIFPWYAEGQPILWWSPDPRFVLDPTDFCMTRRLRRTLRKRVFEVTFDTAFAEVIRACADVSRKSQEGTWITREMEEAYIGLHQTGYAHSAESWLDGTLVGGLYGVSLGRCFFGESMFFRRTNASKVAFVTLVEQLKSWSFNMVDAQVTTPHLMSFGAKEMPRWAFIERLEMSLQFPSYRGKWQNNATVEAAVLSRREEVNC